MVTIRAALAEMVGDDLIALRQIIRRAEGVLKRTREKREKREREEMEGGRKASVKQLQQKKSDEDWEKVFLSYTTSVTKIVDKMNSRVVDAFDACHELNRHS